MSKIAIGLGVSVCGLMMSLSSGVLAQGGAAGAPAATEPAAEAPADAPAESAPAADPAAAEPSAAAPSAAAPESAAPLSEEEEFKKSGELKGDLQEDVDDALAGSSAAEKAGETYLFVGARGRLLVIPQFMINLFATGGTTAVTYGVGPEFAVRKNGFEYNLSVWYSDFGLNPASNISFQGNGDPVTATEIIDTTTWLLFFNADFMWSSEFTPEFALTYGAGVGLAPVFGDVHRTQAYPDPDRAGGFLACEGVGRAPQNPSSGAMYCGAENNHYGGFTEPGVTDGGSVPPVLPWVTAQAGLRFKPHRNFAMRFDVGFGTAGFFLGLGADYGI